MFLTPHNFLIATPKAKGLFKKAIAQSGGILGGIGMTSLQDAEKTGIALQEKLNFTLKNIEPLTENQKTIETLNRHR